MSGKIIFIIIIVIAVLVAGWVWFEYFRDDEMTSNSISGQVDAVGADTVTVKGIVEGVVEEGQLSGPELRRETKTITLLITPKTKFIKTTYSVPKGLKDGETFTPDMTEGPGMLSEIVAGMRIIKADTAENLFYTDNATATRIHYGVFSFPQ